LIINGKTYSAWRYEEIVKEQILITLLSQGGISLNDTRNLPINDRRIILNTLRKVSEDKKKKFEEAKERRKASSNNRRRK
jgi:hypothetical protein